MCDDDDTTTTNNDDNDDNNNHNDNDKGFSGIVLSNCSTMLGKHNSTRTREYARIMLPLMSQRWFHILGWG